MGTTPTAIPHKAACCRRSMRCRATPSSATAPSAGCWPPSSCAIATASPMRSATPASPSRAPCASSPDDRGTPMRILYQLTSPMQHTLGAGEMARRQLILAAHAAAGTEVAVEPTDSGPAAIESARDAGLIVPELIRLGPRAEQRGFAALIIGCYSDPGLDALRELVAIPVVGPGAAALHLAAQLGTRIGILTPRDRGLGRVAARLHEHGLSAGRHPTARRRGWGPRRQSRDRGTQDGGGVGGDGPGAQ